MKTFFVMLMGILSFVYLLNPTAGFFEIIPDNIPFVGNLDEATATTILLSTLAYFGIDFSRIFKREYGRKESMQEAKIEDKNSK